MVTASSHTATGVRAGKTGQRRTGVAAPGRAPCPARQTCGLTKSRNVTLGRTQRWSVPTHRSPGGWGERAAASLEDQDACLEGGCSPQALSPTGGHRCLGRAPVLQSHCAGSDTRKVGKSQQDGAREQRRSIWSEVVVGALQKEQQRWGHLHQPLGKALPSERRGGGMRLPRCFPALFHLLTERGQ